MNSSSTTKPAFELTQLQQQNLYQRLGLKSHTVSYDDIFKAKHRTLDQLAACKTRLSEKGYHEAMQLIQIAFATLNNPKQRASYDEQLINAQRSVPSTAQGAAPTTGSHEMLDRFEIGEELARNASTIIFNATDRRTGADVVIRQLLPELMSDASIRSEFKQHAELLCQSTASNIVKIMDFDADAGMIVHEKMAAPLRDQLPKKGLAPRMVVDILRDILAGLSWLHSEGIAHGHIQPNNLLLDSRGGVKVLAMPGVIGLSNSLRPDQEMRHIAPEMFSRNGQPTLAIDVYSLGFLALEVLCGNRIHKAVSTAISKSATPAQWLQWHSSNTEHLDKKTLVEELTGVSSRYIDLILRMTDKDPYSRIQNAEDCRQILAENAVLEQAASSDDVKLDNPVDESEIDDAWDSPDIYRGYTDQRKLTWSEILKQPALLLTPKGRNHLTSLGLGTLCLLAMLFMLLPGSTKETPSVQEFVDVTITVEPDGEVVEIGGVRQAGKDRYKLRPGIYDVAFQDSEGQFHTNKIDVPSNTDRHDIVLEVPQETHQAELPEPPVALPPKTWKVRFVVQGSGQLLGVKDSQPILEQPGVYELEAGQHAAECSTPAGMKFTHLVTVENKPDQIISIPVPVNEPNTDRVVKIIVQPGGRVLAVRNQGKEVEKVLDLGQGDQWKLVPGRYDVGCLDSRGKRFESEFSVTDQMQNSTVVITCPERVSVPFRSQASNVSGPYADVDGKKFTAQRFQFSMVGIPKYGRADVAEHATRKALQDIVSDPHTAKVDQFGLPERAVDPRGSFALALYAYRRNESDRAIALCRRSLQDARRFKTPFTLPAKLIVLIEMRRGRTIAAINAAIDEFHQWSSDTDSPGYQQAADEMSWLMGLAIGFAEDVTSPAVKQSLDIEQRIARHKRDCTDSQWEKYRIGRREVYEKSQYLKARWNSHGRLERDQSALDSNSRGDSNLVLPKAALASPMRFSSYLGADPGFMADEAIRTIKGSRKESENRSLLDA